ncbi:LysE family translocator [Streptomyces sp. NPDC051636]|uniref:LysE family translocator n=1 Tax=Streptomyces sp. NPDC051636 TaxID=3365663 RepID=UPI0037A4968F
MSGSRQVRRAVQGVGRRAGDVRADARALPKSVTNLLNPKVIPFNVSFLPEFVNSDLGHVREQFLVLGVTITAMGLMVDDSVGLLPGGFATPLRRSRRVARGLDLFSGTVFWAGGAVGGGGARATAPTTVNFGLTSAGASTYG